MTTKYLYKIGTTLLGMVNLEEFTPPIRPPKSTFKPFSDIKVLGSGKVRGLGYPQAVWRFDSISVAERTALRTFCTGASAWVYIATKTNDADAYKNYYAVMVWPSLEEERDGPFRIQFEITFKSMIEQV